MSVPALRRPSAGSPLVKVCGVTRPQDPELAIELGADLVGLNFHPASPRCVTPATAAAITRAVAGRALLVGVFVNRPRPEVEAIVESVGLDLVQLHGDESFAEAEAYGARALPVIRLPVSGVPADRARLAAHLASLPAAWGFLLDARHETLYGGTGESWSWSSAAGLATGGRPLLVAGGIHPGNARRALAESGAAGIDVCSGVEAAPGTKDPGRLARLFAAVRPVAAPALGATRRRPGGTTEPHGARRPDDHDAAPPRAGLDHLEIPDGETHRRS